MEDAFSVPFILSCFYPIDPRVRAKLVDIVNKVYSHVPQT